MKRSKKDAGQVQVIGVSIHQVAFWFGGVYVQVFSDGDMCAKVNGDPSRVVDPTDAIRAAAWKAVGSSRSLLARLQSN